MQLLLALSLSFAQTVPDPQKVAQAEVRRLSQEIRRHAAEGRLAGVERDYEKALKLGQELDPILHTLAAEAAQTRGDALLALARYQRVPEGSEAALATLDSYDALLQRYAYVRISAQPGAVLQGPALFAPSEAKSVAYAVETLAEKGWYLGLLPAGVYTFPGRREEQVLQFDPKIYYDVLIP